MPHKDREERLAYLRAWKQPDLVNKQRQAALDRDAGELGKQYLPPAKGRPAGQEARLGARVDASTARRGVYTRGGQKTGPRDGDA